MGPQWFWSQQSTKCNATTWWVLWCYSNKQTIRIQTLQQQFSQLSEQSVWGVSGLVDLFSIPSTHIYSTNSTSVLRYGNSNTSSLVCFVWWLRSAFKVLVFNGICNRVLAYFNINIISLGYVRLLDVFSVYSYLVFNEWFHTQVIRTYTKRVIRFCETTVASVCIHCYTGIEALTTTTATTTIQQYLLYGYHVFEVRSTTIHRWRIRLSGI